MREIDKKPVRSLSQNAAIHLYFKQLAESLNSAGYDVKKTMRQDVEIPWTETLIKELIWRKVQKAMLDIDSTSKLSTAQISEVYEVINNHIASSFGVSVAFPEKDSSQ